jgi:hypothetical protein
MILIGGGTVYAASHLGKNDVKSRNLAPGAVKTSDLGKSAVTSPKIKNGTIKAGDIAADVINGDVADVTGSATGGPVGGLNATGQVPVPLSGTTTFTPQPGQVSAVAYEAKFTYSSNNGVNSCSPGVTVLINGRATQEGAFPFSTLSTSPVTDRGGSADGPVGLVDPGTPFSITAVASGDSDCGVATLDRVEVRILQVH